MLFVMRTAGQVSDDKGAKVLLRKMPKTKTLLADRGYDADGFRHALKARRIAPCIPLRKTRKRRVRYDKKLYKKRHKVENMFAKIKDWRPIAMRYDRCAHTLSLGHLYRRHLPLLSQKLSPEPKPSRREVMAIDLT